MQNKNFKGMLMRESLMDYLKIIIFNSSLIIPSVNHIIRTQRAHQNFIFFSLGLKITLSNSLLNSLQLHFVFQTLRLEIKLSFSQHNQQVYVVNVLTYFLLIFLLFFGLLTIYFDLFLFFCITHSSILKLSTLLR